MAAEVARSPSQTTGGGGNGGVGVGVSSSAFHFNSPSSSITRPSSTSVSTSSPQGGAQQQYPSKPQQYKPNSPSPEAPFFSHHPPQRMSPTNPHHLQPANNHSERTVPRALPPMSSPDRMAPNDPRLPVSPGDTSMGDGQDMVGDPTAPRKRSKVSRACDECRRKKIRCDASSESGVEQCSSCKRVGSKCSFSRVPMKRGPSKGYIKELADRLNTLENSISTGTGDLHHPYGMSGEGELSPGPSDSTSPPPTSIVEPRPNRKRTLSSSSEFQRSIVHLQPLAQNNNPPAMARQAERLPSIDSFHPSNQHQHQQRSRLLQHESQRPQLPPPPTVHHSRPPPQGNTNQDIQQQFSSTTISTDGTRQPSYWKGFQDRRASVSFPYDIESQRPTNNPVGLGEIKTFEWDEESIDQYYTLIHPTFPLLPHSKARLRQRLAAASITVREALLEALYAAVRSNPSCPPSSIPANPRRACELCVASQFEAQDPRSSTATSLLYLQTTILMALEADNHSPATTRSGTSGMPKAAWVGSAVGLAYAMKLHCNRTVDRYTHSDPDSDEKLGRRAWWVLVVLDRWHAISTSSPLFIPDSNVVLLPEDQTLIGLTPWHLVRLSCILGHLSEAFTTADEIVSAASLNPYISRLLRGELERFRESVEVVWGSLSLLHVAYYHVKLLVLRHNSASEPRQLLEPALRMATMLDHSSMPITPLNHHFAALALITLVDLGEVEETRLEARRGVGMIDEAIRKRRGLATREDSKGWDRVIKEVIGRRIEGHTGYATTTQQTEGLRHLAELAIGETREQGREERMIDSGMLMRLGYLGTLGEGGR